MRSARIPAALGAAALAASGLASCSDACDPGECAEPLRYDLRSRCWPDGRYRIGGTLDGEPFEVELTLPTDTGGASSPDGRVVVTASNGRGLEAVSVQGRPSSARVWIRFGDLLVGDGTDDHLFYNRYRNRGADEDCEEGSCTIARIGWFADDAAVATLCALPGETGP